MNLSVNRSTLANSFTYKSLVNDKGLSRLGDSIVNLAFSLAISIVLRRPEGMRASDRVLSGALIQAKLRHIAPKRAGSDQLGDIAESIIAMAWLNRIIEIEDAASIVAAELKEDDIRDRKKQDLSAMRGFAKLLVSITQHLDIKLMKR